MPATAIPLYGFEWTLGLPYRAGDTVLTLSVGGAAALAAVLAQQGQTTPTTSNYLPLVVTHGRGDPKKTITTLKVTGFAGGEGLTVDPAPLDGTVVPPTGLLTGDPVSTRPGSGSGGASGTVAITAGTIDGVTIGTVAPVQAQAYRPVNAQTGTAYTIALTDDGKLVTLSNAAAVTVTVPPNSSAAFPVGAEVDLLQLGAGQVNVAPGAGVTVNSYSALTHTSGQYAGATLKKIDTNTWALVGNLA